VHFEAFGPASVKKAAKPEVKAGLTAEAATSSATITFAKAGQTVPWSAEHATLLDAADAAGVRIEAGCRAGNCGACLVAIKSGEVEYLNDHGSSVEAGSCLACICKPKGALVIDA
jgi:ferredoxin